MKRSAAIATGAALLLAYAFAAQSQEKVSDGVVKIGMLEDMSSIYADITGVGAVTGAKMAAEDFGGKVLGKPIEVIAADHQNKPDILSATAREWFDTQHVDALLDVAASATALAAIELAKAKNKIIVLNGPGATRITIDIRGPSGVDRTGEIELAVTDDGRGFDPTRRTGNGLLNISDRIECVRGSVSITSTVGHGTTIQARIPTAANTLETDSGSARSVEDQAPGASRVAVLPIAEG